MVIQKRKTTQYRISDFSSRLSLLRGKELVYFQKMKNIADMLECKRLQLTAKQIAGLEGALINLDEGRPMTPSQAGFHGAAIRKYRQLLDL